jgi:hypothetical protein
MSSIETNPDLRSQVSELRFDKEALERKLRKFATHCQRLEDDKAGMTDALKSCNIDIEVYDSDISQAIIHLCDRLTSIEQGCLKQALPRGSISDSLSKENETLRQKIEILTKELEMCSQESKQKLQTIQHQSHENYFADYQQKINFLEQENLELIEDLKKAKGELHKTRNQLESQLPNVFENPTIDFAAIGNHATSSSSRAATQDFDVDPSSTMELTMMARKIAAKQQVTSRRETHKFQNGKDDSKKRSILSNSTNQSETRLSMIESSAVKRQCMVEVNQTIRERRSNKTTLTATPGLGETSSAASPESTGECTQS